MTQHDTGHRWGFSPHRSEVPTVLWATLLCFAFVFGLLMSALYLTGKPREKLSFSDRFASTRRYFDPCAVCEAIVAILSGVLLWMGFWDLLDEYLVPKEWWAKLCMLIAGGLGLFATRTLYDEQTLQAIRGEEPGDSTSCGVPDADPEQPGTPHNNAQGEAALASVLEAMSPPIFNSHRDSASSDAAPGTLNESASSAAARRRRCCCFDPPRFSCTRCGRALAATFSGLTLWVGIWDLVDAHLLPELVSECNHEPNATCALVKLLLIVVGALGLFCTRSLYGDSAPAGSVQFQRIQ